MKVLFLCNKSPWPAKEGGPMAMNMFIEGLADAGHEVKVIAVNSFKYQVDPAAIPKSYRDKTAIELQDADLRVKPVRALLNLFSGKSYHVSRFNSEPFRLRLIRVLRETQFDIVQLETLYMTPYIATIREHSTARIILRAHNIEHLIWQRIGAETLNPLRRWYIGLLASRLKKYEEKIVAETDGIVAITPTDAAFFRKFHPVCTSIPFGIDPANYEAGAGETEYPSLFSFGAMNWIPNAEGIRWFLMNVWPDVHRQFPDLKYYLAGREMPGWMLRLNLPNVVVLGEVPDSNRFLASKAVMIVPLFSGSGIRIKIIEGMAAGKTIISTSLGAEGIGYTNRENILIADAPCEFFEMISICVSDKPSWAKIGKQARTLIETEYLPGRLVQNLLAFYQQVAG